MFEAGRSSHRKQRGLFRPRILDPGSSAPWGLSDSTPHVPFCPPGPENGDTGAPSPLPNKQAQAGCGPNPLLGGRLVSLDVFRGLAVVGMILVNNPGDPAHQYPLLAHAPWDGLTLADLVFPFFLLSVGISLTFMLVRRDEDGRPGRLYGRLLRRSALLVALGVTFHLLISRDVASFRVPGVLQRIGVCSFLGGVIILNVSWKGIAWTVLGILAAYALILMGLHAPSFLGTGIPPGGSPREVRFEAVSPGLRPGYLSMAGSLPSYVDRWLFGRHLYRPEYDPEGLLGTLSALSSVLIGTLAGLWLRTPRIRRVRLGRLVLSGVGLALLGGMASRTLPINKALWTPSFVLVTSGIAIVLLAGLTWLLEARPGIAWFRPIEVFGANALLVYILSNLLTVILSAVAWGEKTLGMRIYEAAFLPWAGRGTASIFYASLQAVVWLPLLRLLHRKELHLRI